MRVEHGAPAVLPGFGGGGGGGGVDMIGGPGGGVQRVRLDRKTPAHLARHGFGVQSRPRVWKRLMVEDHSGQNHADAEARRVHQDDEAYVPVERVSGACAGPRLQAVHEV